jgi:MoaA/NifB/PqqE/SkfB family radical SAM enzyme
MPMSENIQIHQLDLEIHGACNYKCEMCPQAWGRERAFLKGMPLDLFKKIVDDALQYGLVSASLHGSGEPTLNRNLPEMVKYLKEHKVEVVSFTNGQRLTRELSRSLFDAGLDILRISAIGCDEASYDKWMEPGAYDTVRDNARAAVAESKALGSQTQVHLYHLISEYEKREEEVVAYQENWIDYTGALAEIWLMHNWSGLYEEGVPYHREPIARARRSCGRPFSPLLEVRAGGIDGHAGAVVACCMVLGQDSKAVLGHLDHQSIAEVVSGDAYQSLRQAHSEERFDDISYCQKCDQLFDVPEALVWSNVPGRQYGESKIASGLDHRTFAPSSGLLGIE